MAQTLVATNLATNPSFETAGAAVEVRRNFFLDPDFTSTALYAVSGTGTASVSGGRYAVVATAVGARLGLTHQLAGTKPAGPYTLSVNMERLGAGLTQVRIYLYDTVSVTVRATGLAAALVGNNRYTFSLTATGAFNQVYVEFIGSAAIGNTTWVGTPILESGTASSTFFSGSTAPAGDFTYRWLGAANASESVQEAPSVVGYAASELGSGGTFHQSKVNVVSGIYSGRALNTAANATLGDVRISGGGTSSFPLGLQANNTYTIKTRMFTPSVHTTFSTLTTSRQRRILVFAYVSGAYVPMFGPQAANVSGWSDVEYTFTMPATATGALVGLGAAGSSTDTMFETWWDTYLTIEGVYTDEYFDGSTPSTPSVLYVWNGTANASTSSKYAYDSIDSLGGGRKLMWFGNERQFNAVPMPATGMKVSHVGYTDRLDFQNGAASVLRSAGSHKEYGMDFPVQEAHAPKQMGTAALDDVHGLDVFNKYATGFYGNPNDYPLYFADPMNFRQNLFPENWASPGLIEQGWDTLTDTRGAVGGVRVFRYPMFTPTVPVDPNLDLPYRQATFDIIQVPLYTPTIGNTLGYVPFALIPIPPGYVLHYGASATATGTARILMNGSPLTLLPTGGLTRMNHTVSGVPFAKFWIDRSTNVSSTLTISSMMAQLYPIWETPTLPQKFIEGKGNSGLKFDDDANEETYVILDEYRNRPIHYKGLSTRLVEVSD